MNWLSLFPIFADRDRWMARAMEHQKTILAERADSDKTIRRLEQQVTSLESEVKYAREQVDLANHSRNEWVERYTAVRSQLDSETDVHRDDLRKTTDFFSYRMTGRTIFEEAPAVPPPTAPAMEPAPQRQHPRAQVQEMTEKANKDMAKWFADEQKKYQAQHPPAPESEPVQ